MTLCRQQARLLMLRCHFLEYFVLIINCILISCNLPVICLSSAKEPTASFNDLLSSAFSFFTSWISVCSTCKNIKHSLSDSERVRNSQNLLIAYNQSWPKYSSQSDLPALFFSMFPFRPTMLKKR